MELLGSLIGSCFDYLPHEWLQIFQLCAWLVLRYRAQFDSIICWRQRYYFTWMAMRFIHPPISVHHRVRGPCDTNEIYLVPAKDQLIQVTVNRRRYVWLGRRVGYLWRHGPMGGGRRAAVRLTGNELLWSGHNICNHREHDRYKILRASRI